MQHFFFFFPQDLVLDHREFNWILYGHLFVISINESSSSKYDLQSRSGDGDGDGGELHFVFFSENVICDSRSWIFNYLQGPVSSGTAIYNIASYIFLESNIFLRIFFHRLLIRRILIVTNNADFQINLQYIFGFQSFYYNFTLFYKYKIIILSYIVM